MGSDGVRTRRWFSLSLMIKHVATYPPLRMQMAYCWRGCVVLHSDVVIIRVVLSSVTGSST